LAAPGTRRSRRPRRPFRAAPLVLLLAALAAPALAIAARDVTIARGHTRNGTPWRFHAKRVGAELCLLIDLRGDGGRCYGSLGSGIVAALHYLSAGSAPRETVVAGMMTSRATRARIVFEDGRRLTTRALAGPRSLRRALGRPAVFFAVEASRRDHGLVRTVEALDPRGRRIARFRFAP
jgi:hypothetical protein